MAAFKVFHTIELVECILLQLPIRDVLQIQRVSKTCCGTVLGSIKLQRALFLEPMPQEPDSDLLSRRSIHFMDLNTPCDMILQTPGRKTLLAGVFPITKKVATTSVLHCEVGKMGNDNPSSSWRHMLSTQPPRTGEFFFGNFADRIEMPIDLSLRFTSASSTDEDKMSHSLASGAVITCGKLFHLSAVKIEKRQQQRQAEYVKMGDVAMGLEELMKGWDEAEVTGKVKGDFGWAGYHEFRAVSDIDKDLLAVVTEEALQSIGRC